MTSTVQNFTLPAGDDVTLRFTVSSDDMNSTLDNVTIYWWAARYKTSPQSDIVIKKDSATGGIAVADSVNRIFDVTLSRADTLGLIGRYYHEAKVVDDTGGYITVTTGKMTVSPTIVRTAEDS